MMARPCRHPGCAGLVHERGTSYCPKHAGKARRPCGNRECPNLVPAGVYLCPSCQRNASQKYEQERESAHDRGYDATWTRVRLAYLHAHPLCERCLLTGALVPSVLVHHKVELSKGGERLDPDNLEALCRPCHEKTHGRRWRK